MDDAFLFMFHLNYNHLKIIFACRIFRIVVHESPGELVSFRTLCLEWNTYILER